MRLYIIIILLLILLDKSYKDKYVLKHNDYPELESNIIDSIPELNKDNVLKKIIYYDIKEPLIVYRQVMQETMHLRCDSCCIGINNLFGFTNSSGMLKYDNWVESIEYYKEWQNKYFKGGDYYEFLKKYWGAKNMDEYIKKVKGIKI